MAGTAALFVAFPFGAFAPAFASAHGPYTRKQAVAACRLDRGETPSIKDCADRLMEILPPFCEAGFFWNGSKCEAD
jgi:hypothetical protein